MLRSERSEGFWQVATVAPRQETLEVPKPRTGAIRVKLSKPGVPFRALAPGELVKVRTRNSRYRLIVLDPLGQKILIQGGRHFPCSTEVRLLDGSSVLELLAGAGEPGCGLQFALGDKCFMTSPIMHIKREGPNVVAA